MTDWTKCYLPEKYTRKIADFILFFSTKDEGEAIEFFNKLRQYNEDHSLDIVGYRYNKLEPGRILQCIADVCELGVDKLLFITENFIADEWMLLQKDEQITINLLKENKSNVIPLFTKPKEDIRNLPSGLHSFTGFYIVEEIGKLFKKMERRYKSEDHRKEKKMLGDKQKERKDSYIKELAKE